MRLYSHFQDQSGYMDIDECFGKQPSNVHDFGRFGGWFVYTQFSGYNHWCTVIIAALKLGRGAISWRNIAPPPRQKKIQYPEPIRVTRYWSGTHQTLQDSAVSCNRKRRDRPVCTSFCSVIPHYVLLLWLLEVSDSNNNLETKLNVMNPTRVLQKISWLQVRTPCAQSDDFMIL